MKDFSSLLLDIKNMSRKEKLVNFMSCLKPWAWHELRRQSFKDLSDDYCFRIMVDVEGDKEGCKGQEEKR